MLGLTTKPVVECADGDTATEGDVREGPAAVGDVVGYELENGVAICEAIASVAIKVVEVAN